MTDNFLPAFRLAETMDAPRNKLRCQVRGYEVPATPEERVRQRVLHWLINTKSWSNLRLEKAYRWESDPNRSHIRPDIELLDDDENVVVVVECKHENVPLSEAANHQAIEYAIKSAAPHIWVTNGKEHRFLEQVEGRWQPVSSIAPLGEEYEPPTGRVAFPNVQDAAKVESYFEQMDLATLNEQAMTKERDFTLALHKAIFDVLDEDHVEQMPFSSEGVHLLEYAGIAFHEFSNRGGGRYYTRYADFVAATRGRVEALSVAVNAWYGAGVGIRLCVGVSKAERKHHACCIVGGKQDVQLALFCSAGQVLDEELCARWVQTVVELLDHDARVLRNGLQGRQNRQHAQRAVRQQAGVHQPAAVQA